MGSVEIPLTESAPGMRHARENARIDFISPQIWIENRTERMIVDKSTSFIAAADIHAHTDRHEHHMIDTMNY